MSVVSFITRVIAFTALAILLILGVAKVSSIIVVGDGFRNDQIESNVAHIRDGESYDFLMMGISHARMFSLFENHQIVQQATDARFKNIGMGGNQSDIALQRFYLQYFLSKGNKARKIILVMSPPMMLNESLSLTTQSFFEEPVDIDFLRQYLMYDAGTNNRLRTFYYIKTKYDRYWWQFPPKNRPNPNFKTLARVDSQQIEEGMRHAYDTDIPEDIFHKNKIEVEKIIRLAQSHSMEVILLITPTVFGRWQYHDWIDIYCHELVCRYKVRYYDYSLEMRDKQYYHDHHHFNAHGVHYFSTHYLRKMLKD